MKRSITTALLFLAAALAGIADAGACVPAANVRCNPNLYLDRIDGAQDGRYNYGYDGNGVDIYIVDGGISAAAGQSAFGTRYAEVANFTSEPTGSSSQSGDRQHAIAMAQIAAGPVQGVANGANLRLVRVRGVGAPDSALADGLRWIRQNPARNPRSVVNVSITAIHDPAVDAEVAQLLASNVPVFVSAGNKGLGAGFSGGDACGYSPAGEPDAFTVSVGEAYGSRDDIANYGVCVDGFASHNSTSEATALATGVAALIWQQYPSLDAAGVIAELRNRARRDTMTNTPVPLNGSQNLVVTSLAPAAQPPFFGVSSKRCYGRNTLQWLDAGPDIFAYELQRSATADFAAPATVYTGMNQAHTVDVAATTYYRVRACNSRGCSAYVNGNRAATYTPSCP